MANNIVDSIDTLSIESEALAIFHQVKNSESQFSAEDLLDWLDSPEKIAAYRRVSESWQSMELMDTELLDEFANLDCANDEVASIKKNHVFNKKNMWRGVGIACSLLLCVFLSRVAYYGVPQDYQASKGKTQTITLSDGSSIKMESNARLVVREGWGVREVTLISGNAYFEVTKNTGKPFSVYSEDITTTVLGTQFNVSNVSGLVKVAVKEGKVRVDNGKEEVYLVENQLAVTDDENAISKQDDANVDMYFSWQQGVIQFDQAPLSEVVARLRNYYPSDIHIVNPTSREKRISGTFSNNDVKGFINAVSQLTSIKVEYAQSGTLLIH